MKIRYICRAAAPGRYGTLVLRERGATLVEVAVAITIIGIILSVTVPTVSVFTRIEDNAASTSQGINAAILTSNVLGEFIRGAVQPAPDTNPFIWAETYNSVSEFQFTTNNGDPNGPDLITASITPVGSGYTFTMIESSPVPGTCPFDVSSNLRCQYAATPAPGATSPVANVTPCHPTSNPFQYGAPAKPLTEAITVNGNSVNFQCAPIVPQTYKILATMTQLVNPNFSFVAEQAQPPNLCKTSSGAYQQPSLFPPPPLPGTQGEAPCPSGDTPSQVQAWFSYGDTTNPPIGSTQSGYTQPSSAQIGTYGGVWGVAVNLRTQQSIGATPTAVDFAVYMASTSSFLYQGSVG